MTARRRSAAILAANMAAAVLAACSATFHPAPPPPPIPDITTVPSTTALDFSGVSLGGALPGATTVPAISVTGGKATFKGTVLDDIGAPVPGATVELQRVVGTQVAVADFSTASDGTWVAAGVQGGVYRIRAWLPPDLAQSAPQVVFIGATDTQTVNLSMTKVSSAAVLASVSPNPPMVGMPATIVAQVTEATVGADGYVRGKGQGGVQLQLISQGAWQIEGTAAVTTSSSGEGSWVAVCEAVGPQPLSALLNGTQVFDVTLPACVAVPPSTAPPSTTATTLPARATTTLG